MLKRGKARSIAVVALARKLLELVYILLKRREHYWYVDESRLGQKYRKAGLEIIGAGG
jgi:hypothetical protein